MGAEQFCVVQTGDTMAAAFRAAKAEAQYDYGHGGYTGTIAEKPGYMDFGALPEGVTVRALARVLGNQDAEELAALGLDRAGNADILDIYDDKSAPAVGIRVGAGQYAFMGWASS